MQVINASMNFFLGGGGRLLILVLTFHFAPCVMDVHLHPSQKKTLENS